MRTYSAFWVCRIPDKMFRSSANSTKPNDHELTSNEKTSPVCRNMTGDGKARVLIPKRGRDAHLGACLHYLDNAAETARYPVVVSVVDEGTSKIDANRFRNLIVEHLVVPSSNGIPFQKGHLLNQALNQISQDFTWLSLVDVDMLYSPTFLSSLNDLMTSNSYVISTGHRLNAVNSAWVLAGWPDFGEVQHLAKEDFSACPSQVSMSRDVYELFTDVFGTRQLIEGDYRGWGAEDSELSYKSRLLEAAGLLTRIMLRDSWVHLFHPPTYKKSLHVRNLKILNLETQRAGRAVREHLERRRAR
jgi:hypothetical protein